MPKTQENKPSETFQRFLMFEGTAVLLATPFLIFPYQFLPATVAALLLIIWLWTRNWRQAGQILPPTPFNGAMLLFGLSTVMGLLVSDTPDVTIPKATGLILGLTLWRFVLVAIHTHRRLIAVTLAYLLLGSGIMVGGLFVVQWYVKIPYFERFSALFPPYLLQLPGSPVLGVSPNQLAGTILLFLPLTVVAAIRFWPKKRNNLLFIIAIISLVLTTFLLVLTQSRSGWIGAAAAVMAVVGLYIIALPPFKTRLFTRTRIITALIALTAVALLAISLVPSISQNMNSTIGELPKSSSYNFIFRQEVWRVGVDAAGDNYLTGVGLGSFRRVFTNDYESNISPEIDIAHAHNIFLQVLLDLGVPGLAAYLALLLISVNIGWNLISTYDPLKPLAISLLAGLFGFHIYSLTDTISLGSKTHFVFWLLMGILAGLPQMSKLASDEAEP